MGNPDKLNVTQLWHYTQDIACRYPVNKLDRNTGVVTILFSQPGCHWVCQISKAIMDHKAYKLYFPCLGLRWFENARQFAFHLGSIANAYLNKNI